MTSSDSLLGSWRPDAGQTGMFTPQKICSPAPRAIVRAASPSLANSGAKQQASVAKMVGDARARSPRRQDGRADASRSSPAPSGSPGPRRGGSHSYVDFSAACPGVQKQAQPGLPREATVRARAARASAQAASAQASFVNQRGSLTVSPVGQLKTAELVQAVVQTSLKSSVAGPAAPITKASGAGILPVGQLQTAELVKAVVQTSFKSSAASSDVCRPTQPSVLGTTPLMMVGEGSSTKTFPGGLSAFEVRQIATPARFTG